MSTYQLEIKQVVDYPRCRIYRQFIKVLMEDRSIRMNGSSGLFYYTVLCNFANFRTSYKRVDGITYTICPGEWICTFSEMKEWFRCRTQKQALRILEDLQNCHLIQYSILGHGTLIKYEIIDWRFNNRILEQNAPCQKDTGFFFLPISVANELVGSGKCGEMDALLDLWVQTIYNDERVEGSSVGPIVYIRNGTGNPLLSYDILATRWGISKATVSRFLKKLELLEYISLYHYEGTHGTVIQIKNYLSTMFEISDVMIDKEELAMALNLKVSVQEEKKESNVSVSKTENSVSKSLAAQVVEKVAKILLLQGFSCSECNKIEYLLSPLSDCKGNMDSGKQEERFLLTVSCFKQELFRFDITVRKEVG